MEKNKWINFLKMFDLEIGDEFEIKNMKEYKDCVFLVGENKFELKTWNGRSESAGTFVAELFGTTFDEAFIAPILNGLPMILLSGAVEIEKKKKVVWGPNNGIEYWYVVGKIEKSSSDYRTVKTVWSDSIDDYQRYSVGNFFKTMEEASNNVNMVRSYLQTLLNNFNNPRINS